MCYRDSLVVAHVLILMRSLMLEKGLQMWRRTRNKFLYLILNFIVTLKVLFKIQMFWRKEETTLSYLKQAS